MPDADIIPIGDPKRRAPSKNARNAGATGPKPKRPPQPRVSGSAVPVEEFVEEPAAEYAAPAPTAVTWEDRVAGLLEFLRRRATGDYEVDEFGFDAQLTESVIAPMFRPLYRTWWRVDTFGLENVPADGAALVVANHSGTVAFDAVMTQLALLDDHPAHRHLRMLGADLVFKLPFVGEMARKAGNTLACAADAERLLTNGNIVGVWPEGFKGVGKPFSERYKLQRFGRGGFAAREGADHSDRDRRCRRDVPDDRQRQVVGPSDWAAVLPTDADVPVARSGRHGSAAHEVDDRVRRTDPHRRVPGRISRRPDARFQPDRSGARVDPEDALRPTHPPQIHLPRLKLSETRGSLVRVDLAASPRNVRERCRPRFKIGRLVTWAFHSAVWLT